MQTCLRLGVLLAAAAVALLNSAETSATPCTPVPPGLVSWWPGDGNALDITDGNHGTLRNGAWFGSGLVGQAFDLDGVDDFVEVAHSASFNFGTDDFTLDLWVNFDTTTGEQVLMEKFVQGDAGLEGWSFSKLEWNTLRFGGAVPPAGMIIDAAPPSIPTGTWVHVAVTHSHGSAGGHRIDTFTVYWNGVPIGSVDRSDDPLDLDTAASLKFGHRCSPADTPGCTDSRGFYLDGLIDEVEIFDRALNASEIGAIYAAGAAGKCKGPAVGGIAELSRVAENGEGSLNHIALAALASAALLALTAGGWYARRRSGR